MPLSTPLVDFAEDDESRYQELVDEASTALAEARSDLGDARDRLRSRSDALSEARESAEALRSRLADAPTPGDGEELLEDLVQALIEAREALRGVHRARAQIRDAEARTEAEAALRDFAERRLRAAGAAVEDARSEAELRERWIGSLDEPPLNTLKADADDLRNGSDLSDLADDLEAAIPEELREAALKRRELKLLRRTHARELSARARDLLDGTSRDPTAEAETAYRRVRSALAEYVREAPGVVAAARSFLGGGVPEIGEGEEEDLEERSGDGAAAANREVALTSARIALENRRFELREAELGALADPDQDPSVVSDAEDAVAAAESDRDDALADFEADDHRRHLERWELALPDEVWRFFLRFHEVTDSLDRLATLDPGALESDLLAAATALATAREEAADEERRRRELSVRGRALDARRQGLEEEFDARMFSAVRGDG